MTLVGRALAFLAHGLVSLVALVDYGFRARGRALVFRHAADVDTEGLDRQMGPLVDALRARGEAPIEVVLVALDRRFVLELARVQRALFSQAAVLGPARAWALIGGNRDRARTAIARVLLRIWRPRCLYLIDESGSGQPWVRAARELGIRSVGIQHGDFQPWNRQYAEAARRGVVPADVLCVWSPWFRSRLLRLCPLYDERNTLVTGRLRYPSPTPAPTPVGGQVLIIADASPDFARWIAPYLRALERAGDLDVAIAPHPGASAPDWGAQKTLRTSLAEALGSARLVLGTRSSALLEALHAGCAVAVLVPGTPGEASYADAQIFPVCGDAERLPEFCRALLADERTAAAQTASAARSAAREIVWGGAPIDSVTSILESAPETSQQG